MIFIKYIALFAVSFLLIIGNNVNADTYGLLEWNLVNKNGKMYYQNKSKYFFEIRKGINIWNKEAKIIKRDNIFTTNNVTFSDVDFISAGVVGETGSNGTIRFATTYMDKHTSTEKLNVCIHEIGHALGIDHLLNYKSVMFPIVTNNIKLSKLDKQYFKEARKKYKTI